MHHFLNTLQGNETRKVRYHLIIGSEYCEKLILMQQKLLDEFVGTWERYHVGFDSERIAEHGLCD